LLLGRSFVVLFVGIVEVRKRLTPGLSRTQWPERRRSVAIGCRLQADVGRGLIDSAPPRTLVLSVWLGKSCPSPAVPTKGYAHSVAAAQSESPSAALPVASGRLRLATDHNRHARRRRDTGCACRVPAACRCCAPVLPLATRCERLPRLGRSSLQLRRRSRADHTYRSGRPRRPGEPGGHLCPQRSGHATRR